MTRYTLPEPQRAAALAAIRANRRHRVGLHAKSYTNPQRAVAFPIDPTTNLDSALHYALNGALGYWPDATTFQIVGADLAQTSEQAREEIPTGAMVFSDWEPVGEFFITLDGAPGTATTAA